MQRPFLLVNGTLKDYDWGSATLLASLQDRVPTGRPEAELWFGTHPSGMSTVTLNGADQPLTRVLDDELPYLVKLLAAARPLSIQAHPTADQAREGFERENQAGIPVDAPHRNYQDPHHKPEMLIALTHFVALCGFRDPAEASLSFQRLAQAVAAWEDEAATDLAAGLQRVALKLADGNIQDVFTSLLDVTGPWANPESEWVRRTVQAVTHSEELQRADLNLATLVDVAEHHPADPGLFVALMMNRVDLAPGQALFIDAGRVHAYVSGLGFEVMAASNNVLRGGLTSKHVDVAELENIVDCQHTPVPYLEATFTRASGPRTHHAELAFFRPAVQEFAVTRADISPHGRLNVAEAELTGPLIAMCTSGAVALSHPEHPDASVTLSPGQAALITGDQRLQDQVVLAAGRTGSRQYRLAGFPEDATGEPEGSADHVNTVFLTGLPAR